MKTDKRVMEEVESKQNPKLVLRFAKTKAEKERIGSFFGLFRISISSDKRESLVLYVNLRRLVVSLVVLMVVGYLTTVCGLYAWRVTIPHNQIEFVDILIPNGSRLSDKEGKTRIAQGMAAYEAGDSRLALFKLRAGLSRYPQDFEARYTLAEVYCEYGMLDHASKVLKHSFDWGYPGEKTIELFLYIAQFQHNFALILSEAERFLAYPELKQERDLQRIIYKTWISAMLLEEEHEQLYRVCHALNNDDNSSMKAYDGEVFALIQLGRKDEVVPFLESIPERVRRSPDYHVLALTTYLRLGQLEEALQAFGQLIKEHPLNYTARANGLIVFFSQGGEEVGVDALDAYLKRFEFNDPAIAKVAELLTDIPASRHVKRCLDVAAELNSVNLEPIRFLYVQSLIKEAKWEAAAEVQRVWSSKIPDGHEDEQIRVWMDALIAAILDSNKGSREALVKQLNSHRYQPEVYLESAIAMQRTENHQPAVDILGVALKFYPYSREFTTLYRNVNQKLNDVQSEREIALRQVIDSLAEQRAGNLDEESFVEEAESVSDRIRKLTSKP